MASPDHPATRLAALVATVGLVLGAAAAYVALRESARHDQVTSDIVKYDGLLKLQLLTAQTELEAYLNTGASAHLTKYYHALEDLEEETRRLAASEVATRLKDTDKFNGLDTLTATLGAWRREYAEPAVMRKTERKRRLPLSKRNAALTLELDRTIENAGGRSGQFVQLIGERDLLRVRVAIGVSILAFLVGSGGLWSYVRIQREARRAAQEQTAQLDAHARRIEVIADFSEKLLHTASDDHAARHLVTAIGRFSPQSAVLLATPDGAGLRIAAVDGPPPPDAAASPLLEEPAACPVMRTSQRFHLEDVRSGHACACPVGAPAAGGYACLPLTSDGRITGLVNWKTGPGRPLLPADVQHVESLARITSLVLATQYALAAARSDAETDTLTGAFNRRFLDSFLEKQVQTLLRHEHPLGVLMMDLDRFKAFNDRHGHPAGDALLRLFARTAHETVRQGDLVARYGGEEFTVVLPHADRATTFEIAERIRSRFAGLSAADLAGAGLTGLEPPAATVSIGVAVAPADGTQAAAIIRAADAALYRAKQEGRNRVSPAV